MKALVLERYSQLEYEDVPEPELAPDEVLIRVEACGICGSDVHGLDGSTGRRIPPIIMGHEAAGVVARVGPEAANWQEGQRVTFDSAIHCGDCYYCRRGLVNLCERGRVVGVSTPDFRMHGALAECVAVPARAIHLLPEGLPSEKAALLEPLTVAAHAVGRTPLVLHDTVVVVGAGIIGLLAIQLLRRAGCGRIIAVDLLQERLDLARRLGADAGLRADQDDVPAQVRGMSGGRGADVAVDAVGIDASVRTAVSCLRKGGALTLVGILAPEVELPLERVVLGQLSLFGSATMAFEAPACLDMLASGAVEVEPLISAVAPLCEGAAWFERLRRREPGLLKVILKP